MDPFSVAVDTRTLVQLCITSSTTLRNAIKAIKTTKQEIKHLLTEIEYLIDVLQALERNVKEDTDTFDSLKFVLEQCTQACKDLNKAISNAAGDSKQPTEGISVWIRLKCQGSDIEAFKKLIDSYKATLTIAIADFNLGTTRVTKGLLEDYIQLSNRATVDLEERIEELSIKLDLIRLENRHASSGALCLIEEKQTLERKTSLEQCLTICLKLIDHIQSVRPAVHSDDDITSSFSVAREASMRVPRMMDDTLDTCAQNLSQLRNRLECLALEKNPDDHKEISRLLDDINAFKQCLAIYTAASEASSLATYRPVGNILLSDYQTRVETLGDLINVKKATLAGRSSRQLSGLISDASFEAKLVDELQLSSAKDVPKGPDNTPEKITSDGIEECRISMAQTAARLGSHMQETLDRMLSNSSATKIQEDTTYLARLREEWATARKCRDICALANQNLKENISVIDNHATGNKAVRFLVSNSQKTIHGKNRGYGDHIKQLGGHLSDQSIQKLASGYFQMSLAEHKERLWPTHLDTSPILDEARKFKVDSGVRTSSSALVSTLEQSTDTRIWPTDVTKDNQTRVDTSEDLFDIKKVALAGRSARQLTGLISDASFQTMVTRAQRRLRGIAR